MPMSPGGKRPWSRPLADFVDGCVSPALARHGFGQADIVTCWPEIVGERVAGFAEPVRLRRSRRVSGEPATASATLVIRVEGAFALELQHIAPVVVERINAHLGWRCVGRLDLRQAPLRGQSRVRRDPIPRPSLQATRRAGALTAGIVDGGLRDALTRLGARVIGARAETPPTPSEAFPHGRDLI